MTTPNQAREIIYAAFAAVFGALDPEVPFAFDNEEFTPPDASAGLSWVHLTVKEADSAQETLGPVGGRRYQRTGVVAAQFYVPANGGTARADALVKVFRDTFEGVTLSGVYFLNCQVVELGIEGASWRVNALASFWFEETK